VTARGAIGRPAHADQPGADRPGTGRRAATRQGDGDPGDAQPGGIAIRLDEVLAEHGMTLTELSDRVGITVVNLSVLKNGRARAIRFSTLAGLCSVLGCQPGDLLSYEPAGYEPDPGSR
jgi:putative transcriptional regulator